MGSESSFLYAQEPATDSYPEPDESGPHPHILSLYLEIHFTIFFSSTSMLS
jgi:hypothetical protein